MERTFAVPEAISSAELKNIRKKLSLSRKELAALAGVSVRTLEYWETGERQITGPIVFLMQLLEEDAGLVDRYTLPEQKMPLRLLYRNKEKLCTLIDADENVRRVQIVNFTDNVQYRAFGVTERPTYEQYREFLESRCFPPTMDKMKLMLRELNLPFYDPLMIIEKTKGRMTEDLFWIEIVRK